MNEINRDNDLQMKLRRECENKTKNRNIIIIKRQQNMKNYSKIKETLEIYYKNGVTM